MNPRTSHSAHTKAQQIEAERAHIASLDEEISIYEAKHIEQRRRMGGPLAVRENGELMGRQIKMFEGRLDKALVKFNESLARNKELREQIDHMRRERVVFDGVYRKIEVPSPNKWSAELNLSAFAPS